MDAFLADVDRIYKEKGNCMVAVSEGIHYADGTFVSEAKTSATDGFGHAQLGGLASMLANIVKEKTGAKVRGIELSLLQRCGAHLASETDIEESYMSGKANISRASDGNFNFRELSHKHQVLKNATRRDGAATRNSTVLAARGGIAKLSIYFRRWAHGKKKL